MKCHDLILQFLSDRGLDGPDGRELYAYRCTNAEFEALQVALREELGDAQRTTGPFVAQAFCIWGAEWWRRNHHGGHWAWGAMLAAVGCEDHAPGHPYYRRLCEVVCQGMRAWKRELLRAAGGRAFLVTLACEGGLPLRLVLKEQARLRRFFQALLEEIRLFGRTGLLPEELAERVDYLLPKSLRQDIVYRLSGKLVARVWQLQAEVGQSDTPVRDLDRKRPDWRNDLPLSVGDDVARALLNNLLLDATDVARGGSGRVRWTRTLVRGADGYRLVGELFVPGTLRRHDVEILWPNVNPLPRRFEIWIEHEGMPPTAIAFATQRPTNDGPNGESDVVFALEHVSGGKASLPASAVAAGHTLVLRALREEAGSNAFSGAMPLSDLPWVFEEPAEEEARLRLVGEGSTTVRAAAALVALPAAAHVEPSDEAVVTELGLLSGNGRRLVRVRGTAVVHDSEENRVTIGTGAATAEEIVEFRLHGPVLELGRDRRACYLGPPRVLATRPKGITTAVEASHLEWKSQRGGGWSRWGSACVGEGTVRLVEGGWTRWSTRLCILPAGASVEFRPGSLPSKGSLRLCGFGSINVAMIMPEDGVRFHVVPESPTDVLVEFEAEARPPADLELLVRWPKQGDARLALPFPARDARFEGVGLESLEPDPAVEPVVAVNRLSRVRAVVVAPERGEGYRVLGSFRGEAQVRVRGRDGLLLVDVPESAPGLYEQGLGVLQQAITSRFAFSSDPDAYVRLIMHSNVARLPVRGLRVARFDIELRRVGEDTKVRVSSESLRQLSWTDLASLRLEAIPLLWPDHPPVMLERAHYDYMWHFPESRLDPGPWLVVAWDGNWCRARPLWWFVAEERSEAEGQPHRLLEHFLGDARADRRGASARLVAELKTDTSHPGWPLVDAQVELTQHLPAVTLELLCALAEDQEAAALAALRAPSENDFLRLWRGLETLPFWWRAVPAEDWMSAGLTYAAGLHGETVELEELLGQEEAATLVRAPFDRALARVKGELPFLRPVLASVTARCFSEPLGPDFTRLLRQQVRSILLEKRQPLLANAYVHVGVMTRYPDLTCVSEMAGTLSRSGADRLWVGGVGRSLEDRAFQVHNAPIAAALSSLEGRRLSESELFSLRTTSELAPWWFSEVFDLTFLCAFGIHEERRIRGEMDE